MSRPTPETDAAWSCFKGHTELLQDVKDLSRKLERERDEARIDRANGDIATMTINHYERILRERDEAREALEEEKKWHHRTHKELIKAQCKLLDIEYDKLKS